MSRGDGTTTVDYIWDVAASLPLLLQDGTSTYVYGIGLISIYDGTDMTYRLVDGLGSTVNLCDGDGNVIGSYTYDAYGNVRSQSGSQTEFSYAGEQNDPNGLDYLRARYYDPEIGRFLSSDPAGQGTNSYWYALANPLSLVDPTGLWTTCYNWISEGGITECLWHVEQQGVRSSQLVLDPLSNSWVPPSWVEQWEKDDWVCFTDYCVSQIELPGWIDVEGQSYRRAVGEVDSRRLEPRIDNLLFVDECFGGFDFTNSVYGDFRCGNDDGGGLSLGDITRGYLTVGAFYACRNTIRFPSLNIVSTRIGVGRCVGVAILSYIALGGDLF